MLKFRFLMLQSEQRLHVVDFISAVLLYKTFKVPLTLLNFLCLTLLYAVRFEEYRWCDRPGAKPPLLTLKGVNLPPQQLCRVSITEALH